MILISDGIVIAIAFGSVILIMAGMAWDLYKRRTGYVSKKIQWEKVEAKTTGTTRIGEKPIYSKVRLQRSTIAKYTEYAIKYEVDGKVYVNWFNLFPGPDLGDIYGEGTTVLIKYNVEDPDEFEVVKILVDR